VAVGAGGNAEKSVLRYTVTMMLPAKGLIAVRLIGEAFVTVDMILDSRFLTIALSLSCGIGFAFLLYGLPLVARDHGRLRSQ
jgi:hypothetical protein